MVAEPDSGACDAWPRRRGQYRFRAPSIPMPSAVLRPLARLYFNRILKKGVFPTGWKAHKALDPASGPATPAQARVRLEEALGRFEHECRRRAANGQQFVSTGFGTVSVEDFAR